ncbi:MAG: MASE1 domain-containing protein [Gemmatimonadetes bacterium]|nr:MASE1 domain-containing protein [Gemmatimonadota bacterium]
MTVPGTVKAIALYLGLGALYFLAGKFGLKLAFAHPSATAVWPPTGIALAAFLTYGRRVWPAIFGGAFFVNLTTAGTVATTLGIATGNTLEGLVGAALVERWAGGPRAFRRAPTVLSFALLAAVLATVISPSLGVGSLALGGFVPWREFGGVWLTWWLGDMAGALVVAPVLLMWIADPRIRWHREQTIEAAILLILLLLASETVFGGPFGVGLPNYPLGFVFLPLLLWTAFRLGTREAAAMLLLLAGMAIDGTLHQTGPFVRDTPNESLLLLQVFLAVSSVTTLAFGALVDERRAAEARLLQLSASDPLTGLANYRQLMTALQGEIRRSDRTERGFAIVFLDLDKLKQINDRHGHLVGSRALCRVAEAIRKSSRAVDTSARFGGDEFAVVLPEADEAAAWRVADRIRDRLALDLEEPRVTVSVGLAVYPRDGTTVEELVGRADHILYEMKARNG